MPIPANCPAEVTVVIDMRTGRSMEGKLVKITKILVILFIVIAVILNFNF